MAATASSPRAAFGLPACTAGRAARGRCKCGRGCGFAEEFAAEPAAADLADVTTAGAWGCCLSCKDRLGLIWKCMNALNINSKTLSRCTLEPL